MDRPKRGEVIRHMFENIEQGDQVVSIAIEHRQVGQLRFLDLAGQALVRDRASTTIQLTRVEPAELLQHGKVVPRTTADLQDPRFLRRLDDAFDQALQDSAPRQEPPMMLVELDHAIENGAFHKLLVPLSRALWRGRSKGLVNHSVLASLPKGESRGRSAQETRDRFAAF